MADGITSAVEIISAKNNDELQGHIVFMSHCLISSRCVLVFSLLLAALFFIKASSTSAATDTENSSILTHLSKGNESIAEEIANIEMVAVQGGCFKMGDGFGDGEADERPAHEVCVDNFMIGKYEVSNAQYLKFRPTHSSGNFRGISLDTDEQPVVNISWEDAKAFAEWLTQQTGKRYRLPTEAEWEYAARGGTEGRNYWGDRKEEACRYANVHDITSRRSFSDFVWEHHNCDDGFAVTSPVGKFRPNALGLYDMMGNVWEWVQDWYGIDYYKLSPGQNPVGSSSGKYRVLRGGSWYYTPQSVRSAVRNWNVPSFRSTLNGFRVAAEAR